MAPEGDLTLDISSPSHSIDKKQAAPANPQTIIRSPIMTFFLQLLPFCACASLFKTILL